MNIYYTNANDLKNKTNELAIISSDDELNCRVLCITETMFSSKILDAEISVPNFKLFRNDRLGSKGGGSCIYTHNSLHVTLCDNFNVPDCIAVEIDCNLIKLIIIVIYRSPSLTCYDW